MKDVSKIAAFFVAVYLLLRFLPAIPISSVVTQKQALFSVDGTGKVTIVPDTAVVDLGITITRPTVKTAQTEVNSVINKISADLKAAGLAEKDIQTSHYSVYPNYDYQSGTNRVTGYQVSTGLTVTIKNLDKINTVIDTATADGANTVGGVQLTVDEDSQKQLLQQARQEAVKDAKAKAESLAHAAGLTLGRIVNIQESAPSLPRPYLALSEKAVGVGGGGEPTQIQPGSTDITSSVTLSYETR